MQVLVDAYNLYSKSGTGISRYTRELCRALNFLNHNVFLQFGVPLPQVHNELLAKAIVFKKLSLECGENKEKSRTAFRISRKINNLLNIINDIDFIGENIFFLLNESDKKLFDDRIEYVNGIYNQSNMHIKSEILFSICKKFLSIRKTKNYIDIYHKPFQVPCYFKYAKNITTIHDIIPLKIPYSTTVDIKNSMNLQSIQ